MGSSSADLETVRRIVLDGRRGREARVYLFGSWARAEAGRYSDIDVGILSREPLPDELLATIEERLEESEVPYVVDLVDLSSAAASLRERVLAEGVPWNA